MKPRSADQLYAEGPLLQFGYFRFGLSGATHRVNPAYNTGSLSGNRSTLSTTR
jgi:hypothetical protein